MRFTNRLDLGCILKNKLLLFSLKCWYADAILMQSLSESVLSKIFSLERKT